MADTPRETMDIAAYYALGLERDRLAGGSGALEFARTQSLLQRYLPPSPAVVADIGGGPGRYAVWLAERGYQVHLVDPVPLHVEQARRAAADRGLALASTEVGDARALRLRDASVDAVLLLGPLYHLIERADRVQALAEARRICRPGGVIIAAAISRFASTLDGLREGYLEDPAFARRTSPPRTSIAPRSWPPSAPQPDSRTRPRWPWRDRVGFCLTWMLGLATRTVAPCSLPRWPPWRLSRRCSV